MMTEQEYRALPIDSYSSIKVFIEDRKKYYKKYILGEVVKEDESYSLTKGSLIDCLLLTPSEFVNRYVISFATAPVGQYGKLVEELVRVTNLNPEMIDGRFEELLKAAYVGVKYDKNGAIVDFKRDSFETVKDKFFGTEVQRYYEEIMRSQGKSVIDTDTYELARAVVNDLKTSFITSEIINAFEDANFKIFRQFPIIGELGADITKSVPFPCKCLVDLMHIDHLKKIVYIYDLKTTWDNESEFINNYSKYKYYLQGAIYFYLVKQWIEKQAGMGDYKISLPIYIVAESNNYKAPLIYVTSFKNLEEGMKGFHFNGRYYPGVIKAVQDIMWHKEIGIWNISRDNFENNGIVPIKPFEK